MTDTAQRLLIVDDEAINREILYEYLAEAGYELAQAENGEEGWEILDRSLQPFDAILLDRMMPRLNGMQLLARIKADRRFKHLPVIFQTAAANPSDIAEGLQAGAYYYLTKPYTQEVLLAIVRSALTDVALVRNLRDRRALDQEDLDLVRTIDCRFRSLAEARRLTELLARFFPDPTRSVVGIAELLINAVEHGNLSITYAEKSALLQENRWEAEVARRLALPEHAEKEVMARLELSPHFVVMTVVDQGLGFDWQKYLEISPERAYDPNGRGIAMARMISFDSVEYRGLGNEVVTWTRRTVE